MSQIPHSVLCRVVSEVATASGITIDWTGVADGIEALPQLEQALVHAVRFREITGASLTDQWLGVPFLGFYAGDPVCVRVDRSGACVMDPGSRVVDPERLSAVWVLHPTPALKEWTPMGYLRAVWKWTAQSRPWIWGLGIGMQLLSVLPVWAMQHVLFTVVPTRDRRQLFWTAACVGAVLLGTECLQLLLRLRVNAAFLSVERYTYPALWSGVLRLKVGRGFHAADVFRRISAFELGLQALWAPLLQVPLQAMGVLLYGIWMLCLDLRLTCFYVCGLCVLCACDYAWFYVSRAARYRVLERSSVLDAQMLEGITYVERLRAYQAEDACVQQFRGALHAQQAAAYTVAQFQNRTTLFHVLFQAAMGLALYWGVHLHQGAMTLVILFPFLMVSGKFSSVFLGLVSNSLCIFRIRPTFDRVRTLLEGEHDPRPTGQIVRPVRGAIRMEGVAFRYGEQWVLSQLDWEIRPGQMVAIVGPTGSGKSTVLRLLLGLERPSEGRILYDGVDLAALDVEALREQMGVVLQQSPLFPGTIYQNIRGRACISDAEVGALVREVGLERDLASMPMGLYTWVSEEGRTLSGGQRQKILLARALSTAPAIMVLDEATSALDPVAQQHVFASLARRSVTRLVVAHRLSTVREADWIFVLSEGRCVEAGTYDDLYARGGMFYRLCALQSNIGSVVVGNIV